MQTTRSRVSQRVLAVAVLGALWPGWGAVASPPATAPDPLEALETRVAGLDVDELTREACYAEIDAGRERQRAAREQMRTAHTQLSGLLEREAPPEDAVMAEADHIAGLVAEARKTELRTLLRILSLLDEDARAQLRARPAGFLEVPVQRDRSALQHRF